MIIDFILDPHTWHLIKIVSLQGLASCKKHQASLGALTVVFSRAEHRVGWSAVLAGLWQTLKEINATCL